MGWQAILTTLGSNVALAGLALGCAGADGPGPAAVRPGPASVITEIKPEALPGRHPRFVSVGPPRALEGEPYRYRVSAFDDGEEVHLTLLRAPEGATLDGTVLKWTPEHAQVGRAQGFTLRAADGHGAEVQDWTVIPEAEPHAWVRTRH